jgi:hypothetical protein
MKKNLKKLRLNRETLAHLDAQAISGGRVALAIVTSCTYPCDCQPGCTADNPCLDQDALA